MEIIDLTYSIHEKMLTFAAPWHPKVMIKQLGRLDVEGRETRQISFGTHTGTQVDAPLHFIKNGKSIDMISLDKLVGPVTIVDFSDLGEGAIVTKEMLEHNQINKKMIFKFGWSDKWNTEKFYSDWPHFSLDAAKYLLEHNIEFLGIDTPSPDDPNQKLDGGEGDSPIHKLLLADDVVIVEYIANLGHVKDYIGWNIAALPLKIQGADGSPARVFIFR